MVVLKKLTFAPIFLIFLTLIIYFFAPFLKSLDLLFSLSLDTLYKLILISSLTLISSLAFVLLICIAVDWKLTILIIFLASLIPFIFLPQALSLVLAVLIFSSLLISNFTLDNKLKNYLSFKPIELFTPSVKQLAGLLLLALSITYYFSISAEIGKNGFQIPDSLIETALNISTPGMGVNGVKISQVPNITPEQLELLRQNPDLLKQYGIDPKLLDTITAQQPKSVGQTENSIQTPLSRNLIKQAVKDQIQNFVKPYLGIIPAILAALLFFTLQSIVSLLSLLLSPMIWLIFYILEKSRFIKFTTEMREVKKMIV